MAEQNKYDLDESAIPDRWYNIAADLPNAPSPPPHPGTGKPIGPDDLAPLSPMGVIEQEVSAERWIEIPAPESAHAIRSAIDEAEAGEERAFLFNLSGHGFLDLAAYQQYFAGELEDYADPKEQIAEALRGAPQLA